MPDPTLPSLRPWIPLILLGLAACAAAPPAAPAGAPGPRGQAVATENHLATEAAAEALEKGASAADAAIVAALVAGVVAPVSSGIGGGGFALVYEARTGKVTILDFRETAPAGYDAAAAEAPGAAPGHAVGVPGEVAGLFELHRRWGKRPFADDVAPAAHLAERGFPVPAHMARSVSKLSKMLAQVPGLASVFMPGGVPSPALAQARIPALGATLRAVGQRGPAAFYEGPTARAFVEAARRAGSPITEQDLASYRVAEREPLRATWGDFEIATMPPPSGGGLTLLETLAQITPDEAARLDPTSAAGAHTLAEIFRGVMADRFRGVGDPDSNRLDLPALLAPARLKARKAALDPDKTRPIGAFLKADQGTTHLITADREGNIVSLTTTVNSPFGARLFADDIGVLLNDELNDFLPRSAAARAGLSDPPGSGKPGARPPSSMSPTLVLKQGKPALALGGSGGLRIGHSVTQVALAILGAGWKVEDAVKRPRVHVTPDGSLLLEPGATSAGTREDLARRGEQVREEESFHAVQALFFRPPGGVLEPAADPRKLGQAWAR